MSDDSEVILPSASVVRPLATRVPSLLYSSNAIPSTGVSSSAVKANTKVPRSTSPLVVTKSAMPSPSESFTDTELDVLLTAPSVPMVTSKSGAAT